MPCLRTTWAAGFLLCVLTSAHAQSSNYPSKPIHFIVPAAPGGVTDIVARALGQQLTEIWHEQVVVENRSGANNQIAAEIVAKAPADGYTLFVSPEATFVINPYLYKTLHYDPHRDFTPISGLIEINQALIVRNGLGVNSVAEFLALAKQKPGTISFGGYGIGSTGHLNMEMLQHDTHVKFIGVQYKGATPALNEIMGGHLDAMFISTSSAIGPWKNGQMKILAIGSKQRIPAYSDIPTVAEAVPEFVARSWFGIVGPAGMPKDIVAKLNSAVANVFQNTEFQERFLKPNFFTPIPSSPEEFAAFISADSKKWQAVIKAANVTLD
jgi:tripartite-type tricarboxylate transporter receptor subunit TctC